MDTSDKVQIGLSAAAVFVGMQIVQNGKSVAKSLSAYKHVVGGTETLVKCKEIIESEAGRAINPELRTALVDTFLRLQLRQEAVEQEYNSAFNCIFKHSNGQAHTDALSKLHGKLISASHVALAYKILDEAELELRSSVNNNVTPAPCMSRQRQDV